MIITTIEIHNSATVRTFIVELNAHRHVTEVSEHLNELVFQFCTFVIAVRFISSLKHYFDVIWKDTHGRVSFTTDDGCPVSGFHFVKMLTVM